MKQRFPNKEWWREANKCCKWQIPKVNTFICGRDLDNITSHPEDVVVTYSKFKDNVVANLQTVHKYPVINLEKVAADHYNSNRSNKTKSIIGDASTVTLLLAANINRFGDLEIYHFTGVEN